MCKCIFRRHDVNLDLKLRLFNSYVMSQYSHAEVSHGVSPNTRRIGLMPVKIAGSEELCGLRIKTASQTKRSDNRYNVQSEQTDAIKMVRACFGWKSTHWPKVYIQPGKDQEDDRRKDGWTVLKRTRDLWRSGVTKCGKTAGRQRITLNEIAADKTINMEEPNSGINCWNLLDDDYLTWL